MDDSAGARELGRFLTLADTAEILAITPAEALDLVRSNELPAIRIGSSHSWRVERLVLESYIEAKYEEARRIALWEQSDFASISELSQLSEVTGGRIVRPVPPNPSNPSGGPSS